MSVIENPKIKSSPKLTVATPGLPSFITIKRSGGLVWPSSSVDTTIPTGLFLDLLRLALEQVRVDERYYLQTYPDVSEAIERGEFVNPRQHYVEFGYYEDRFPFRIDVDEAFYFSTNPDIKVTVNAGLLPSAQVHFDRHGYKEGRLPREGWSLLAN